SPDTIRAMPPELLFDYLGVRLNGEKAAGKRMVIDVAFTDLDKSYALMIENGTLNYSTEAADDADAKLTLSKAILDNIQLGQTTLKDAVASGDVKVEGKEQAVSDFLGLLDTYPFWFNIVTP
ncbi:MAG: alkyl sulfatase C-terminal domain-containing protein, partial [Hyphomicrobium sp.]|uniref:alkyl sulfatase C-terminal domain-containing protein n=1 Tax=Hyphomicrobium sp. TaxID=82 RepID=UPI003D0C2A14